MLFVPLKVLLIKSYGGADAVPKRHKRTLKLSKAERGARQAKGLERD